MLISQLITFVIYSGLFYWRFEDLVSWVLFSVGLVLGVVLLELDERYLYRFYDEREVDINKSPQLLTRSVLFLFVLVVMGLFVATSAGSILGSGVIIGLSVRLLIELIVNHKLGAKKFNQRFLWQLKNPLPPDVTRGVVVVFGVFVAVVTWVLFV